MLRLSTTVAAVADVLTAYDTLRLYSAATETGAYALILAQPLVAGQTAYSFLDLAGTVGTWYRTTYYSASSSQESQPGPAFSPAGAAAGIEPARPQYLTPRYYLRQRTGMDASALYTAVATSNGSVVAGAASIVVDTPANFAQDAIVTISDGQQTENVLCLGVGSAALTISPTQYAHPSGVCLVTPGPAGSLADVISDASDLIDNYCQRSFYQQTVTETQRLIVDVEGRLFLRPRTLPVTSVASVAVRLMDGTTLDLTTANVQIDSGGRTVLVTPYLAPGSLAGLATPLGPLTRMTVGQVTTTYTGGYAELPQGVVRACVAIITHLLSDAAANAAGLAGIKSMSIAGQLSATRADPGADLPDIAKRLLAPYQRRAV